MQAGGLGLEVHCPASTLARLRPGERAELRTRMVVREDAWTLYGFHDPDAARLFDLLTGVSGVGPKLALALLSAYEPATLAGALSGGDVALLHAVSGVGKKTAERLVLELAGKVPPELAAGAGSGPGVPIPPSGAAADAISALVALGFREAQVRQAVTGLAKADPDASADTLIRKGLGKLR